MLMGKVLEYMQCFYLLSMAMHLQLGFSLVIVRVFYGVRPILAFASGVGR